MNQHRQLAAILFTDIVGYTAMMQQNETKTIAIVKHYVTTLKEIVAEYNGEIVNDYGDGTLCTFPSATAAIRSAVKLQRELLNEPKVPLRIGIHSGEVFFEEGKVMGDSVNVASRIQSLGQSNTILLSKEIFDKIKNQPDFKPVSLGKFHFKSVDEPMEVFALANDGLQVPKREEMEGKLRKQGSLKRNLTITAAFLVLAILSIFLYTKFFKSSDDTGKEKSVAIIPFNVSGQGGDELSNGLVEDILAHLMKIKDLKVISNRSSMKYAGSQKSSKEIGEALGVNSLILGNIQQIGNRIKVAAQLIESKSGKMIWTDVYDRNKLQIFDLQTELATEIVNALKTNLTAEEKRDLSSRNTGNIEAYKLYRKGQWFLDKRTTASFDSAEHYFKAAIELDPDYALAYVGLADMYILPQNGMTQVESMPIAKDYVMKALSLDSTLSEALTTLGFIQSAFDYDWNRAKVTLEKAIALNPNYPSAHRYYGNLLLYNESNVDVALNEMRKAVELDPLSSSDNWVLGRNYYFAGKIDSGYDQLKRTIALDPQYPRAKSSLALVLLIKKKYAEAIELIRQLPRSGASKTFAYQGALLSYAYATSGDTARARSELVSSLKESPNQSPFFVAIGYVGLKEYDKALTWLEEAYRVRDINMYFIKAQPELGPIRNEARFKALMKQMNLK